MNEYSDFYKRRAQKIVALGCLAGFVILTLFGIFATIVTIILTKIL